MEYADLLSYYGSPREIAKALGIKAPSVYSWRETGIPPLRQVQIEELTGRKLKAATDVYEQPSKRGKEISA